MFDNPHVNPGQLLAEVPLGNMIRDIAMGIAAAQRELDSMSIQVAQTMASETLDVHDAQGRPVSRSLLELGFEPSFYQVQDCTIELAVEIKVHSEESSKIAATVGVGYSRSSKKQQGSLEDPAESTGQLPSETELDSANAPADESKADAEA